MNKRYELMEREQELLEEIEESIAKGGDDRHGGDSLYGFCARLVRTVPQADDGFRKRLGNRLVAGMREGAVHKEDQGVSERSKGWRVPSLRRLLPQALMPVTHLGWAALLLGLLLTFSAVGYAVAPAVGRLFQQEAGLQHVEQADLVQELDLSQTVNGVTVTLERAYADANRIVVGYRVEGPKGRHYDERVTLTEDDTVFPMTTGFGTRGQSDIYNVSLPPGEGAYVLSFDASPVEGAPEELDLRLTMELREIVPPTDTPDSSPGSSSDPAEPMVVELEPMPQEDVVGTFAFDFSVPFIPGRVAEVNQTLEAAGVTMKLERLVVTPSETRAYLRFDPPTEVETSWTSIVTLKAPGERKSREYFYAVADDSPVHIYGFPASLYERRGEWTLTVAELVGTELVPPYEDVRLAGPWVFRFRVP
ncbi:MAG: DUF4179 domain-containing protein [Anaerolineales bacterium]